MNAGQVWLINAAHGGEVDPAPEDAAKCIRDYQEFVRTHGVSWNKK